MTFFVASMVVINHGGAAEKLSKPLWIFWVLAACLLSALFLRLIAVRFAEHYFVWLAGASFFWVLTGISWLFFSMPYLFRVPGEERS